jgi:hypothetical protein
MRLEPPLRSVFFWLMTPEELNQHLAREAEYYRALAATSRQSRTRRTAANTATIRRRNRYESPPKAGIRLAEALADWASWAQPTTEAEARPDRSRRGTRRAKPERGARG